MPLLKFDLIEGRTQTEIKNLLDATHCAVLAAFDVPAKDRYQIVTEHKPHQIIAEDTGLGFDRSPSLVILTVVTSPRSSVQKENFLFLLQRELTNKCGLRGEDLIVSFITNEKSDWSFGNGIAQYTTGDV